MTDLLTRTACGLYVMPDGDPRGWSNFTWTQPVVDMPSDDENNDAIALIGKALMEQAGTAAATGEFVTPRDIAFACLHPGDAARVDLPALAFADPEVPAELIDADNGSRVWTVCGVLEDSWRTVHYSAEADTPLVAYYRAWQWCRDYAAGYLLLAAVHEGYVLSIGKFGYADPLADTPEAMAATSAGWGPTT